jgi:succinate dehydrogenase/fumarate reductase flavoprotein subunit
MSVGGYSIEEYVGNVIDAGRYINRRSLVKLVALRSIRCIRSLEMLGLRFRSSRDNLWVVGSDPAFYMFLETMLLVGLTTQSKMLRRNSGLTKRVFTKLMIKVH